MIDRQFVTALARGLDILKCFDQPGAEHTVSELARRVGLNQPTTWRLCHTLIACGYLVRLANGALKIGAPALTLGYAAIQNLEFPAIALPYMQRLTELTTATTTLSLQQQGEMMSIQQCAGAFVLPNQPIGWRSPLASVASGLAVLAALPVPERNTLLAEIEAANPKAWPRRLERVERACAEYAAFGNVTLEGMLGGHYAGIAVPIMPPASRMPAWAISCGGVTSRWDIQKLRDAGRELLRLKAVLEPALACTLPTR